jgi:hypothetical protein
MPDGPNWKECAEERQQCRTEIFAEINRINTATESRNEGRHREVMAKIETLSTAKDVAAGREVERETTAHKPVRANGVWNGMFRQVIITVVSTVLTTALLGGLMYALLHNVGG